ncbi:MAG: aspartate/glutamate racemase family protein [Acidobacteriota bacterium]
MNPSGPLNVIGGPTIGLLAGMGVSATAPFLEMVIDECRRQYGATHQYDFPQMIIFSWPVYFRLDQPLDKAAFGGRVAEGVRWLTETGVDLIAIPANLPHILFDTLREASSVPLLNMIEIASESVPPGEGPVALLATRPVRDSGLYHRPMKARGIELVATDTMQDSVDEILAGLWRGDDARSIGKRWRELLAMAATGGARRALLACTDLNAIDRWEDVEIPIVDATRALAARVVSSWYRLATGPKTSP